MEQDETTPLGDIGSVPVCAACGSAHVACHAWACWSPEYGLWQLEQTSDRFHCHACGEDMELRWTTEDSPPNNRIRELNDRFRISGHGNGSMMITIGVQSHGEAFVHEAITKVREMKTFTKDNNPWGEHDFGAIEIAEQKVFWKIDYYDPTLAHGSVDPTNEARTHRVLTIMLADEY